MPSIKWLLPVVIAVVVGAVCITLSIGSNIRPAVVAPAGLTAMGRLKRTTKPVLRALDTTLAPIQISATQGTGTCARGAELSAAAVYPGLTSTKVVNHPSGASYRTHILSGTNNGGRDKSPLRQVCGKLHRIRRCNVFLSLIQIAHARSLLTVALLLATIPFWQCGHPVADKCKHSIPVQSLLTLCGRMLKTACTTYISLPQICALTALRC